MAKSATLDADSKVAPYVENGGPPLERALGIQDPFPPEWAFLSDLPTFEIGLVLAGAVSAGAYIGGVLDYLCEALDNFDAAKKAEFEKHGIDYQSWQVPPHNLRIKVVAGASAGGMSAAMLAATARYDFPHVRNDSDALDHGEQNPFYNAWVRQIDMRELLRTQDLNDGKVRSLLDCTALDQILKTVLDFKTDVKQPVRAWLSDPLLLVFPVTNLRGIPYQFTFPGTAGGIYAQTRHDDIVRFSLSATAGFEPRADQVKLCWPSRPEDAAWSALGNAALATGSFPVALRSRTVMPKSALYEASYFLDFNFRPDMLKPIADTYEAKLDLGGHQALAIGSAMHASECRRDGAGFSYASADGGTINNEPLELARVELAGIRGRNPREAEHALRAVLMVDPFPDPPGGDEFQSADEENILSLAGGVIGALKNQSRFHIDEIRLAADKDVHSRFMICPSRGSATGGQALACGAMGGFSGFLDQSYRHHDFLLGRANCRHFLEQGLALDLTRQPDQMALFKYHGEVIAADDLPPEALGEYKRRPIVPAALLPDIQSIIEWPLDKFGASSLRAPIDTRIKAVGKLAVAGVRNRIVAFALGLVWNAGLAGGFIRREIVNRIVGAIDRALEEHGLISRRPGQ